MISGQSSAYVLAILAAIGLSSVAGFVVQTQRLVRGWMRLWGFALNDWEAIGKSLSDGVILLNRSNQIVDLNPAAEGLLGCSIIKSIGQSIDCWLPSVPDLVAQSRDDRPISTEISITNGQGSRWCDMRISPLKNRRGHLTNRLVVLRDITERKEADKARQQVQATAEELAERLESEGRLRQAQKLDAVGQLAGGVAHNLNSVLTVIKGYTAILLEQPNLPLDMVEPLQLMASSTNRGARLTHQLLAYSRRLIMRTQRLNLNEVIGNITPTLRLVLGQGIAVRILHKTEAIQIDADLSMVEQVILNLATNARDAMEGHGQFQLSVETINLGLAETQRNPEASWGRFVCLTLADTGPGMDKNTMDHLFEPFYTTKDVGKGTGMGLATVYGMVKQHNGWVEVHSVIGAGTQFKIFFPVPIEVPTPSIPPVPEVSLHPGQKTILLVEDEPNVRQMVAEVLNDHGYRVLEAADGVEALEVWRLHQHQIDLLLTDVVMPKGITGLDLAQRLLAENPRLKVLYTTGHGATAQLKKLNLCEGINYLEKPYLPSRMLQSVGVCLENG